jgi:hypothetical protein
MVNILFMGIAQASSLDILVIGSTKSFSDLEKNYYSVTHEKPYNPTSIITQLKNILNQDPSIEETVNIVFEDIFKKKTVTTYVGGSGTDDRDYEYHCYSLAQHFMWPEDKEERMANLVGESGTVWDYIILCEDPYVMVNFPGIYAEAVNMIQEEIQKSVQPAELILMGQWPVEDEGASNALALNEIVHRVGDSGGLKVAPGAKAWNSYAQKDHDTQHPTPKGQYLAAAAIYSKMFNRNASYSDYTFPLDGDQIADHVWSQVLGVTYGSEYMGPYKTKNVFQMKASKGRSIEFMHHGSSTEQGFRKGLVDSFKAAKARAFSRPGAEGSLKSPVDFSYSRGTDIFTSNKHYDYGSRLDYTHLSFGFPMGDHRNSAITMLYGIDKRYHYGFANGTDLGVAYSMIREGQVPKDVRGIPVRLLWAKMNHANLGFEQYRPLPDMWHLSLEIDQAVGAYMFTSMSGRCPIETEPEDQSSVDWKHWWCRKMGYETAWRMSRLSIRTPGFNVTPSGTYKTTLKKGHVETMTIQLKYPPQEDVTIYANSNQPDITAIEPTTLIFTPNNYHIPQKVKVSALPSNELVENFDIIFSSHSNDLSFNKLNDSWTYEKDFSLPGTPLLDFTFDGSNPGELRESIINHATALGLTSTDIKFGSDVLMPSSGNGIDHAFAAHFPNRSETTITTAADQYIQMTLNLDSGSHLNLNGKKLKIDMRFAHANNPGRVALLTSLDGFSSVVATASHSEVKKRQETLTLQFPSAGYENIVGTIDLRIVLYGNKWDTESFSHVSIDNIKLSGTITEIEEEEELVEQIVNITFDGYNPGGKRDIITNNISSTGLSSSHISFGSDILEPNSIFEINDEFAAHFPVKSETSIETAKEQYLGITLDVKTGKALNLNGKTMTLDMTSRHHHNPQHVALMTSLNGFSTNVSTASLSKTQYTKETLTLQFPETGYGQITGSIELRIILFGNKWKTEDFEHVSIDNIYLDGSFKDHHGSIEDDILNITFDGSNPGSDDNRAHITNSATPIGLASTDITIGQDMLAPSDGFEVDDQFAVHFETLPERTLTNAKDQYIGMTLHLDSGKILNLNGKDLSLDLTFRSFNNPEHVALFTSVKGFHEGMEIATKTHSKIYGAKETLIFSLPETGYDNIENDIEIRIVLFGNSWNTSSYEHVSIDNIRLRGIISDL